MKKAKLFQNGQSQAVRLPKDCRFTGHEVYIKKVGGVVMLIPIDKPWQPLADSLALFSDDFLPDRNQPNEPDKREKFK